MTEYIYSVAREYPDGSQGKRVKKLHRYKPLAVGGLYAHLGNGYPGMQRVLDVEIKKLPE